MVGPVKTKRRLGFAPVILLASCLLICGCGGRQGSGAGGERLPGPAINGSALSTPGYDYPPDFTFIEVPDPLSGENPLFLEGEAPFPPVGVPFPDDRFSTRLTRVTEADGINGRHEYSRFDPFNCDGSLILLVREEGGYSVFRTDSCPYNRPENLVAAIPHLAEARWDREDPDVLWGIEGFCIKRLDVNAGAGETVKDFAADPAVAPLLRANPDIYRVTMKDEGEPSRDFRYWALLLQGEREDYRPRFLLCWDRESDAVVGIREVRPEESDIDWVGMSPRGNWVLIGGMEENAGELSGLTVADRGLNEFRHLDPTTAHSDVGLDAEGNEVVVMQNVRTDHIDMLYLDPGARAGREGAEGYGGSGRVPLLRLFYADDSPAGLSSGVHVSCNADGYCLVSTCTEPGAPERNWLDRSLVLVRLDPRGPRAFYLAKTRNTTATYWEETHGAMSNDGSRVVWACNWNRRPGPAEVFLMRLDMPPGWRELTGQVGTDLRRGAPASPPAVEWVYRPGGPLTGMETEVSSWAWWGAAGE